MMDATTKGVVMNYVLGNGIVTRPETGMTTETQGRLHEVEALPLETSSSGMPIGPAWEDGERWDGLS